MKQEFVTLPREAVERAVAALKSDKGMATAFYLEISALRAALEQPQAVTDCHQSDQPQGEHEPVGEAGPMPGADGFTMACFLASDVSVGTELYTHPQPKRNPLDVEEIHRLWDEVDGWLNFARAIESAHNIK